MYVYEWEWTYACEWECIVYLCVLCTYAFQLSVDSIVEINL